MTDILKLHRITLNLYIFVRNQLLFSVDPLPEATDIPDLTTLQFTTEGNEVHKRFSLFYLKIKVKLAIRLVECKKILRKKTSAKPPLQNLELKIIRIVMVLR